MKVAVIGAGTMGTGIAQVFAQCAEISTVLLCDISDELARKGKERIEKGLNRLVEKQKMEDRTKQTILEKIKIETIDSVDSADLILEAAIEDINAKKDLFQKLDNLCGDDCIFATNTSSLSITEIGTGLKHTVIGMHFFNPAPVMSLIEVIVGINTSEEIVKKVCSISEMIGKKPVCVNEAPGFVVNRLLIPMINEAIIMYSEGVASVESIDTAMKLGANHPMGPLALADLIGLDVVLAIMEVLHREFGDSKYRPASLLRKMVRAKKLGRKTGEGFYKY